MYNVKIMSNFLCQLNPREPRTLRFEPFPFMHTRRRSFLMFFFLCSHLLAVCAIEQLICDSLLLSLIFTVEFPVFTATVVSELT